MSDVPKAVLIAFVPPRLTAREGGRSYHDYDRDEGVHLNGIGPVAVDNDGAAPDFSAIVFTKQSRHDPRRGVRSDCGVIVGATVTVIDVARGVTRTLVTDSGGQCVETNVIQGTYDLHCPSCYLHIGEPFSVQHEASGARCKSLFS